MSRKTHYTKVDASEKTYLATCICGWRSDCYTTVHAAMTAVNKHQALALEERRERHEIKRTRRYRRP